MDIKSPEFGKEIQDASKVVETLLDIMNLSEYKFTPYFQSIIESNNIKEIQKTIDLIPKEIHLYSLVFLYQKIYVINDNPKSFSVDITLDFDGIRKNISDILPEYSKAQQNYNDADNKLHKLVKLLITTDDISFLSSFVDDITEHSSLGKSTFYKKMNKLIGE